ncbi:MAG TPA: SufD family Fe-S cluster assembly protein [Acholeplasmataceae bacterium]|jgi:Fe-S cluster assembly protein SufD|nr:SufD family Fe-S cluster assembly protein [Acholeplasmataceae bacterium]
MIKKHELKSHIKDEVILISTENEEINFLANSSNHVVLDIEKEVNNIQINVKENAHIKVLLLSFNNEKKNINITCDLERYSSLHLVLGFQNNETNINTLVNLNGEGSSSEINSLIISRNDNRQTAHYKIINNAVHTSGDINAIGIASDNSKLVIDGVGKINKGMHHSHNHQILQGINLDNSKITMNPYLLIDEHDVIAGHGATIGQIDEDILYYMMSRGLTKEAAKDLYIKGVVEPFIDEIFNKDLCKKFNYHLWGDHE